MRKTVLPFAAIVFLSIAIRLLFIQSNMDRDWPFSVFYYGDSAHYHSYAVQLLHGELYDKGIPYHPPLFAWFLSGIYKIMGIPQGSAFPYKVWLAVFNAVTIGCCWLWWRKSLGRFWSLIATAWFLLHFGWLVYSGTFNNEVLYGFFLCATAALTWLWGKTFPWWVAILLGIVMGAGALTRAEHLSLWPFLFTYVWWMRYKEVPFRKHLLRWTISLCISLFVVLPWSIRNARVIEDFNQSTSELEPLSRFALITAYGPANFALANNDFSDGGFSPELFNRLGARGGINLEDARQRHYFIHGYSEGVRWIRQNPARALTLASAKVNRWLDGLASGFGISNRPGGISGSRPPVDLFVPDNRLLKWPLTILLLAGGFVSFRSRYRVYSVCSLILLHRLAVTILFFGYARGMVVMFPVLVPLLLLPFIAFEEKFPWTKKVVGGIFLVLVLFCLAETLTVKQGRNYMASGSSDSRGKIIQDDWVQLWSK